MKNLFLCLCLITLLSSCSKATNNNSANQDKKDIEQVFHSSIKASKEGDFESMKSLFKEDAQLMVPYAGIMNQESFSKAATDGDTNYEYELNSNIQDIGINGNLAWLQSKTSLIITHKTSKEKTIFKGHSLSILEKHNGKWLIIRSAQTILPEFKQ